VKPNAPQGITCAIVTLAGSAADACCIAPSAAEIICLQCMLHNWRPRRGERIPVSDVQILFPDHP